MTWPEAMFYSVLAVIGAPFILIIGFLVTCVVVLIVFGPIGWAIVTLMEWQNRRDTKRRLKELNRLRSVK